MDEKVRTFVIQHEDYQRLETLFPLDFVVECTTNSRRREPELSIGKIIQGGEGSPTLFVAQITYHTRVEFEEFRKRGYTDSQLGEPSFRKPDYPIADLIAKRKELLFLQDIGEKILGERLAFLAFVFGGLAPAQDYAIPIPPYHILYESFQKRIREGLIEYKNPFKFDDVINAIKLFRLGGDRCSGEETALNLARKYVGKEEPSKPRTVEPWMIA